MEHHGLAIGGQADIALDPSAGRNRGAERRKAVFWNARPMEAAVSEPL